MRAVCLDTREIPYGQWGSMGDLLQRTPMNTVKRVKEYERKQRIPTFLTTSVIMSAWRTEAYLKRKQNELQNVLWNAVSAPAESSMSDTVIWCSYHNYWPIHSRQNCCSPLLEKAKNLLSFVFTIVFLDPDFMQGAEISAIRP